MHDRLRAANRKRLANPADYHAHAQVLSMALASRELQEKSLILGAYLGHEACKLVVTENVKPSGVVFKDNLIENVEIRDFLDGLEVWGFAITWRAALGVAKLIASKAKGSKRDAKKLVNTMSELIENPKDKTKIAALNFLLENRRFALTLSVSHTNYLQRRNSIDGKVNLSAALKIMARHMTRNKSCIGPMRIAAIYFDDEIIKEVIRKEVYPFILREYA